MINPWPNVGLAEVLTPVERAESVDRAKSYRVLGARWYGGGLFLKDELLGHQIAAAKIYRVCQGDFVYNRLFAWKGSFALAGKQSDGCYVSNEFPCFRINEQRIEPLFLNWWFRRESAWFTALGLSSGATPTSRNRLKEAQLLSMQIALPPLAEQQRLVARIEELAAQIHEARTLRHQAAEEVEVLLANKRRQCFPHSTADQNLIALEQACEAILDTLHSDPIYADTGIPCVRSPDISGERLDLSRALRTSQEEFERRTVRGKPRDGDIVYCRQGGGTGRAAIVREGDKFSLGQAMMILRPERGVIEPRYLLHQLLSPTIVEDQLAPCFIGTASPRVNIGALRKFSLVLPPLPEQRRIVAELDALQAAVDALKFLQAETAAELDALLPAILDRAFKGEL